MRLNQCFGNLGRRSGIPFFMSLCLVNVLNLGRLSDRFFGPFVALTAAACFVFVCSPSAETSPSLALVGLPLCFMKGVVVLLLRRRHLRRPRSTRFNPTFFAMIFLLFSFSFFSTGRPIFFSMSRHPEDRPLHGQLRHPSLHSIGPPFVGLVVVKEEET